MEEILPSSTTSATWVVIGWWRHKSPSSWIPHEHVKGGHHMWSRLADHRCNGKDGVHFIVHGTIWTPHSHSWKCNPQNRIPQELHEQQLNRHVQAPKANFFMQLPFAATTLGACLVDPNQRSGHPNTVKRSSELWNCFFVLIWPDLFILKTLPFHNIPYTITPIKKILSNSQMDNRMAVVFNFYFHFLVYNLYDKTRIKK